MKAVRFALALALVCLPIAAQAAVPTQEQPFAQVRALDKVTARVAQITLPVGQAVQFGSLSIVAKTCRVTLPEESPPESAAYMDISETRSEADGGGSANVFSGWMFASSPALSAMEHPIYDIWVTGCADKGKAP